jgi:hypothetical protein
LHDVHAQAYDARAHHEAMNMREIAPKYLVEPGKEVGRPPFPYQRPWRGKCVGIHGGANVCPGGQYFDNPEIGIFDEEAMLATTNRSFNTEHRSFNTEHLEKPSTAPPSTHHTPRLANMFRTTYGEKYCWPVTQTQNRASPVPRGPCGNAGWRIEHEGKATLGPPFSVYQPSMEARVNVPRHYEATGDLQKNLPVKDVKAESIPQKDEEEDAAALRCSSGEDQGVTTRYYGEGTGFGVNYEQLAQTRTTKGLRGNAWTGDEFSDTFRTTYSDMLLTGFSTTRARPGSAGRVSRTTWDRNRPRGIKQP